MLQNDMKTKEISNFCQKFKEDISNSLFKVYMQIHYNINIPVSFTTCVMLFSFFCYFFFLIDDEVEIYNTDQSVEYVVLFPKLMRVFYFVKLNSYLINSKYYLNLLVGDPVDSTASSIADTTTSTTATYETVLISSMQDRYTYLKVTLIIIFCLLIFLFACLTYLSYHLEKNQKKTNNWILKIYYYFSLLIYWWLLMPIIDICLHFFTLNNEYYDFYFLNDPIFIFFSIFNIIGALMLCILHAFLGHKASHTYLNEDGFSRADSNFELYYLFMRVVLVILKFITIRFLRLEVTGIYIDSNNTSFGDSKYKYNFWYYFAIYAIFSVYLNKFNYNKLLYYNDSISIIFQTCIFMYIWIIVVAAIISLSGYHDYAYLTIIGFILIYLITIKYYNARLSKITIETEFSKLIPEPYLADKHLKHLLSLVNLQDKNQDYTSKIILSGIGERHLKECPSEICNMKLKTLIYIPKPKIFMTEEEYNKKDKYYTITMILTLYIFFYKQIKHSVILISYLNFQIEEIDNKIELLTKISMFDKSNCSIQQNFSLHCLTSTCSRFLEKEFQYWIQDNDNKKHSMDIKHVVNYYELVMKLKSMMVQAAQNNFNFWNSFIFNSDNTSFYKSGLELFSLNLDLERIYLEIREIYSGDFEINKKYSDYIRLVKGDERLAEKILQSYDMANKIEDIKSLEKFNTIKEFFFSNDSVIIMSSFNSERSSIEKVTESINNIYGYTSQQVLGKEVEILMPPFYKSKHSSYIEFHFETGIKRVVGNERYFYGFHKNHYCFPIQILVMLMPTLDNKLWYMTTIQKLNPDYELLLVLPNGKIDGISEKFSKKLSLSPENLVDNEIYIFHIIYSLLFEDSSLSRIIDLKNFLLKEVEPIRMKYLISKPIIDEIAKLTKSYESKLKLNNSIKKNQINEKNLINAIKETFNSKDFNEMDIETEVIENTYNNGLNRYDNTIFAFKIYLDDVDEAQSSQNKLNINNKNLIHHFNKTLQQQNLGIFNNNTKYNSNDNHTPNNKSGKKVKNIGTQGSTPHIKNNLTNLSDDDDEYSQLEVVKDYNLLKKECKVIPLLKNNKLNFISMNKITTKINNTENENSSYQTSTVNSSFYTNYSNFKRKLQRCLNEEQKPKLVRYIGWGLLVLLIASSVLIFIYEYGYLNEISSTYISMSDVFTNYIDLGCIETNMNNIVLYNNVFNVSTEDYYFPDNNYDYYYFNNHTSNTTTYNFYSIKSEFSESESTYQDSLFRKTILLNSCLNNIIVNRNNMTHIFEKNSLIDIQQELLDIYISISGFKGDLTRPETKSHNLISFLNEEVNYVYNLKYKRFPLNSTDYYYLMNNYYKVKQSYFENINRISYDIINNTINDFRLNITVFLLVRLSIIFICFIIILPLLIVNKRQQTKILESFFQIKQEDAELQRENCKIYVSSTSNIKIDENADNNSKEGNKEKEDSNLLDVNKMDNNGILSPDKEQELKLKIKEKNANKKNKNKGTNHPHSKPKKGHFSNDIYIINILLAVLLVISIISIVPIINLVVTSESLNKIERYIDDKISVKSYSNSMYNIYSATQERFIKELVRIEDEDNYENFQPDWKDNYLLSKSRFNSSEYNFTSFSIQASYLYYFNQLQTLLKTDFCSVLVFHEEELVRYPSDTLNFLFGNRADAFYKAFNQSTKVYLNITQLCKSFTSQNSEASFMPMLSSTGSYIDSLSEEILLLDKFDSNYIKLVISNSDYIKTDFIQEFFVYTGFKIISHILNSSFEEEIKSTNRIEIILFVIFLIIIGINQLVVWTTIENKIQVMETETYKLFSILPLKFILDYTSLFTFLKTVAQDDN